MRLFKIYILALLLGLSGCIEPVEIAVNKEPRALVVNGLITNAPGPYTVKLNRSYYYGEYYGTVHPDVFGATVTITDNEGFSEVLVQKEPGRVETGRQRPDRPLRLRNPDRPPGLHAGRGKS